MLMILELVKQQALGILSMHEQIIITPSPMQLDTGITKIKRLESKINWEHPEVKDFIMMNEMRSIIKGMYVPEKLAEA